MATKLTHSIASSEELSENQLFSNDPIKLFEHWYAKARKSPEISLSHTMTLSTVSKDGRPSGRVVLLQGFSKDGFKFYTSVKSEKAVHLENNPFAALVLYWMPLNRSVRIEGKVEHIPNDEADADFQKRGRKSQLSMHVSKQQSQPVPNRSSLMNSLSTISQLYDGENVPRPDFIQGYRVVPDRIEFYQGHDTLISDRIVFVKNISGQSFPDNSYEGVDGWRYYRLGP